MVPTLLSSHVPLGRRRRSWRAPIITHLLDASREKPLVEAVVRGKHASCAVLPPQLVTARIAATKVRRRAHPEPQVQTNAPHRLNLSRRTAQLMARPVYAAREAIATIRNSPSSLRCSVTWRRLSSLRLITAPCFRQENGPLARPTSCMPSEAVHFVFVQSAWPTRFFGFPATGLGSLGASVREIPSTLLL